MKVVVVNTKDRWSSKDFLSNAIVEEDGAIKWESNGRYLMKDTMENVIANGFNEFSVEATNRKRDAQNSRFIQEYKERTEKVGYSNEEIQEMRNAFGKGAKVVDVLTGKVIEL